MRSRLLALGSALLLLASLGCALRAPEPADEVATVVPEGGMTQSRMELVFGELVEKIEGPSGALRSVVDGVNVYLISDPANDRMRILAPVAMLEGLDRRVLNVLLEANFHSTLDARYAISEGVVYAIYLHPISTLSDAQIVSGYRQVISLARTFGTTFSSGALHFPAPGGGAR